jgi:ketosteroid isomerase-like protein
MRPAYCFASLLAAILGCQAPPTADRSAAAKQAIDANNAAWARLTAAGHADSVAQFYHANAVMLPPNMPPVHGRDAIRAFMSTMGSMSSPPPTLTVRAESVWARGPLAVELGRWHFAWPAAAKRPPGVPAADSGKYLVRWVEEGGRWLMVQDIWNSDLPMPGAQPQKASAATTTQKPRPSRARTRARRSSS